MRNWIGRSRWIGAVLLVGGIVAVWAIRREHAPTPQITAIRPLKTLVLGAGARSMAEEYPARVEAGEQVAMAFEVGGTLIELPIKEGDRVEQGQVLAKLDPRDAKNQLDAAEAELKRAEAQRDRMRIAAEAKAVSLQELSNAEAACDIAAAQRNIRMKSLDDTELKARFAGIIARVMVKNFETVQLKQPILSLQDLTGIEIQASLPEARIARLNMRDPAETRRRFKFSVRFEFLPGREFALEFREFSVQADALTQTFTAKFKMVNPGDVTLLPGMSGTLRMESPAEAQAGDSTGFEVPLDAVPVDAVGHYYVWRVVPVEGDVYRVERRPVQVGPMTMDRVLVTEGLEKGDRIALAGVHILREGTQVRLLEEKEAAAP
jgi:RND family efflux transporter MFP subunit